MVMLVRLLQPLNAKFPMLVTRSGMVMLVRLLQPQNAESPIVFTPSGITMLSRPPVQNRPAGISVIPSGSCIVLMDWQNSNAPAPSFVTVDGIVMSESLKQYINAQVNIEKVNLFTYGMDVSSAVDDIVIKQILKNGGDF
jgi:hypothetical protein